MPSGCVNEVCLMETKRVQDVEVYNSGLVFAKYRILDRLAAGWHVYSCTANEDGVLVVYEKQISV